MLTTGLKALNSDIDSTYGSIHNYYEKLVLDAILKNNTSKQLDHDLQADIACLALNRLPTKYVRYDVDTAFYLTGEEQERIMLSVDMAVRQATTYIGLHLNTEEQDLTENA